MKFHQQPVIAILFSLASFVVLSCVSSPIVAWKEKDGMKLEVPKRMAKLLQKITKYKMNSIGESIRNEKSDSQGLEDIKTVLKRFNLNGLRALNPLREAKNMTTELRSPESNEREPRRLQKRAALPRKPKAVKVCTGGQIYVNLTKYSSIVAPLGFTTVYCGKWYPMPIGHDPVTKIVSQAILETFDKMQNFSKFVFRNRHCCVPSKTKSLPVLYNDPKKKYSAIKYVNKVIVRSCGCHI